MSINGTDFIWISTEESSQSVVDAVQAINDHAKNPVGRAVRQADWSLNGLISTIREQVEFSANPRVVFVDGLDFFKDEGSHNLGNQLRRAAMELDVAIVGTNQLHSRLGDDEVAMLPSGDIGLTAAVDKIVVMKRKGREVELSCIKNRDTMDLNKTVLFDPALGLIWEPMKVAFDFECTYKPETGMDTIKSMDAIIKPVLPIKSQLIPFANLKPKAEPDYPVADWL